MGGNCFSPTWPQNTEGSNLQGSFFFVVVFFKHKRSLILLVLLKWCIWAHLEWRDVDSVGVETCLGSFSSQIFGMIKWYLLSTGVATNISVNVSTNSDDLLFVLHSASDTLHLGIKYCSRLKITYRNRILNSKIFLHCKLLIRVFLHQHLHWKCVY